MKYKEMSRPHKKPVKPTHERNSKGIISWCFTNYVQTLVLLQVDDATLSGQSLLHNESSNIRYGYCGILGPKGFP